MNPIITFAPAQREDSEYFYLTRKAGMEPHMKKIGREWDENRERAYNSTRFNDQFAYLRMIYANGKRIGFICVRPEADHTIWIESFNIERTYQARMGVAKEVMRLVLEEPTQQGKTLKAEIMKDYASGRLAKKIGFKIVDSSNELDIYERPPSPNFQTVRELGL